MCTSKGIRKLLSVARASAKPHLHLMLRGGRLRKTGRGVVSYAPWLGIVAAAMGAGMVLGAGEAAMAQTCPEDSTDPTDVHVLCGSPVTSTLSLSAMTGEELVIRDNTDFSANVGRSHAIVLTGDMGSTGIRAIFTQAIAATGEGAYSGDGISVDNAGTGIALIRTDEVTSAEGSAIRVRGASGSNHIDITANGAINGGRGGINANQEGVGRLIIVAQSTIDTSLGTGIIARSTAGDDGSVEIKAEGQITSTSGIGIDVNNVGSGPRQVIVETAGVKGNLQGIVVNNEGSRRVIVTDTVKVESEINTGILVRNEGLNQVQVTTNEVESRRTGIDIDNEGEGDIILVTNGSVISGASGVLINKEGDGDISIAANGLVDSDFIGIASYNSLVGVTTLTAQAVEGENTGILVEDRGRGSISITASGAVATVINNGIQLVSGDRIGEASITAESTVSSGTSGIIVDHEGRGKLSITSGGAVTATGQSGIQARVRRNNAGGIDINASAKVTAGRSGVLVTNDGTGPISITTADVETTSRKGVGVQIRNRDNDSIAITTGGDVSGGSGISVTDDAGTSEIVVTLGGGVTATNQEDGFAVELRGGANQRLVLGRGAGSITGAVTATRTDAILELNSTAGETGSASFDLSQLGQFSNFREFDKTGTGRWELTGEQGEGMNEFHSADVAGSLRLNTATLRMAADIDSGTTGDQTGTLTIKSADTSAGTPAGTLEIMGMSVLHGDLVNSGTLALGSTAESGTTNDMLTIMGDYTAGGSLTLDVNFTDGNADQLAITGSVTLGGDSRDQATEVNVRATAMISDTSAVTVPTDPLITVGGTGSDDDFTAGAVHDGVMRYAFTLMRDSGTGAWSLDSVGAEITTSPSPAGGPGRRSEPRLSVSAPETTPPPAETAEPQPAPSAPVLTLGGMQLAGGTIMPSVPSYESYAAYIAQLSLLPSLQEDTGLRAWFGTVGDGLWAGVDGDGMRGSYLAAGLYRESTGVFNPGGTMASNSYEMEDVRTRFGFETPLGAGMSVGGNFWFGSAGSDVSSAIGNGEIRTIGRGVAAAVRWLSDAGLYADGQVQYAGFTSDIVVNNAAQVSGNEALSLSAAAEAGYRLNLGGVTLSSRAGVNWSDIRFDDFIDPTLARVSLEDGETLAAVLGVSAGGEWSSGDARGSFHTVADLHLPLDGETGSSVAGVSLSNRLQEPVLHLGSRASWKWGDLHSVYGEVGTAQGGDTEEYRAGIGIRLGF